MSWPISLNMKSQMYSHEWDKQPHIFPPPPGAPGRDQKVNIIIIQTPKSILKIFYIKLHKLKIFILSPGSCPRGGTWGTGGVKNLILPEHGHVAYQIEEDNE